MPSAFHDIVLGASARVAIAQTKSFDNEKQDTIRVFPKACNAPRRMTEEEIVSVFHAVGDLPSLERLELSCSTPRVTPLVLPALALAHAIVRARRLKDLLLASVRLSGAFSDKVFLARAVLNHPTLKRLFVQDCHPTVGSASLAPFLHAAAINPHVETLRVSHTSWAGQALYPLNHEVSRLKSLQLGGSICLDPIEWLHLIEGLQFSSTLKELRISDCPLFPGIGRVLSGLITVHHALEEVILELAILADALPMCGALASNTTLKRLELLVCCPEPEATQCLVASLFADAMSQNYCMQYFILRSPVSSLSNPRLDFFLRLNRCGQRRLLEHPDRPLRTEDWIDALISNSADVSILYYILLLNPALCQSIPKPTTTRRARLRCRKRKRSGSG